MLAGLAIAALVLTDGFTRYGLSIPLIVLAVVIGAWQVASLARARDDRVATREGSLGGTER